MRRANRLFELIQLLRTASRARTAADLAETLEVSTRTVYRDIASLQGLRVPIDGAAGVGYVMRPGYDLPPLNFDVEEREAILVGLRLLSRTGDAGLQRAAARVAAKIDAGGGAAGLEVSDWGVGSTSRIKDPAQVAPLASMLRAAIREERKLRFRYCSEKGDLTERAVLPVAMVYFVEVLVLAAWCELRRAFRHFRLDRITECESLDQYFQGDGATLRERWRQEQRQEEKRQEEKRQKEQRKIAISEAKSDL